MSCSQTASFTDVFLAAIGPREPPGAPLRVLDVGTGTARIPVAICRQRNGIEVTAVDRSIDILRRAQRRVVRAGLEEVIRIGEADAANLPYAAGSFDAVISNGLVHHVPDKIAVLREMIRILRPGGLLFVRDSLPQPDAGLIARILTGNTAGRGTVRRAEFRCRFLEAPTIDEVRILASAAGLPIEWLRQSGPRHWLLAGRLGQVSSPGLG